MLAKEYTNDDIMNQLKQMDKRNVWVSSTFLLYSIAIAFFKKPKV